MNKKIIGYKLIKPEYVNAVISITGIYGYDNPVEFINNYFNSPFTIEGNFIKSLKQAGVLDLWFEPIYEKEVIPEYVECIELPKSWTTYTKIGKIYKTDAYPSGGYRIIYEDGGGQMTQGKEYCFKPSTKEAYVAQNQLKEIDWSKATPEELLAEAKRRYPIGTQFLSPHTKKIYTVKDHDFWLGINKLSVLSPIKEKTSTDGEHVLYNLMWAEIIETPAKTEIKTEQIFTKEQEDYIKNLINNEIKKLQ